MDNQTANRVHSALKKNELLIHATSMHLSDAKQKKAEQKRVHPI